VEGESVIIVPRHLSLEGYRPVNFGTSVWFRATNRVTESRGVVRPSMATVWQGGDTTKVIPRINVSRHRDRPSISSGHDRLVILNSLFASFLSPFFMGSSMLAPLVSAKLSKVTLLGER
jgi:hypothetical protein